jgi:hypothetical protein
MHPYSSNPVETVRGVFLTLDGPPGDEGRQFSERERFVWDIVCFEGEVLNGGLDQFFCNSTGDRTFPTIEALEKIGAIACASILKKACECFPDARPSAIRTDRLRQIDDLRRRYGPDNVPYDLLERELGDCLDREDVYGLLLTYWVEQDLPRNRRSAQCIMRELLTDEADLLTSPTAESLETDLARVVKAWPTLSVTARRMILMLVQAEKP